MKNLFGKKFEIPMVVIGLVGLTIVVLLANALSFAVNTTPLVVLSAAAGVDGAGPDTSLTWKVVHIDTDGGQIWSCAQADDPFYSDWTVDSTFDGTLRECMAHADSLE